MPKEKIYNQLIISIYDSWTYGEVRANKKRIPPLERKIESAYLYGVDKDLPFNDWLLNEYGSSYDSIIVCEDGGIEVLK